MPDASDLQADPRWRSLEAVIKPLDKILVAFSGGADSSFLLAAAVKILGPGQVTAALCVGPFTPPWEAEQARALAAKLQVELREFDLKELEQPEIAGNGRQRCYFCKKLRLSALKKVAEEQNLGLVAEGSHLDDAQEDRPGAKAVAELDIVSPLARAGLDKADIRALGQKLNLTAAAYPSSACLATRIEQDRQLNLTDLRRVAQAEAALRPLFKGRLRVRDHFPLARLVLDAQEMPLAVTALREKIVYALQQAGYSQFCLDFKSYA